MEFHLETHIERPVGEVFAFLRDIDQHERTDDSVVPVYAKVSPGPAAVGTRYLEMVRVLPQLCFEIRSEVTTLEPERDLAYRWTGPGMHGELAYVFEALDAGTRLYQYQTLHLHGFLRLFSPFVRRAFGGRIQERLGEIKSALERGGIDT
ncbi:MAG: SRPBCC family protein [Anaerolineales bacterium]|nr:SRPBCC family protein [Anaerolineales bacterium]